MAIDAIASVSIEIAQGLPVYIHWRAAQSRGYAYTSGMNVMNAVALAVGFTYRANKKSVKVLRGDNPTPVKMPAHSRLLPGDTVTIEERFF